MENPMAVIREGWFGTVRAALYTASRGVVDGHLAGIAPLHAPHISGETGVVAAWVADEASQGWAAQINGLRQSLHAYAASHGFEAIGCAATDGMVCMAVEVFYAEPGTADPSVLTPWWLAAVDEARERAKSFGKASPADSN